MRNVTTWCVSGVLAAMLLSGCGQGTTGATADGASTGPAIWSPAQVESAMRSAGLTGFRQIPLSELRRGKQTPGVRPSDLAVFVYNRRVPDLEDPSILTYEVIATRDPSTLARMQADDRADKNVKTHTILRDNVLLAWIAWHPTAADRATVRQLPHIFDHLNG